MKSPSGALQPWLRRTALGALLTSALLTRVLGPYPLVLGGEQPLLLENDPWFHLRQVEFAVRHFPRVQRFDLATNYPFGEPNHGAGLFDWSVAVLARVAALFGVPLGRHLFVSLLAMVPPVLAIATLVLVFAVVRTLRGHFAAWTTLVFLVLFPGEFLEKSCLGFGDHHAAEVALVAWALWARGRLELDASATVMRVWSRAWSCSLPLALLALTWPGAAIYYACWLLALITATLRLHHSGHPVVWPLAKRAAVPGVTLVAQLLVAWLVVPSWVPWGATFRFAVLGAALIALAGPAAMLANLRAPGMGLPILAAAVGVGAILWFALDSFLPTWSALLLSSKDPLVREHMRITPAVAWAALGPTVPLAGAAAVLVLGPGGAGRTDERTVFVVAFGAAVGTLWLITHDYGYLAAVMAAVNAGVAADALRARVRQGGSRSSGRRVQRPRVSRVLTAMGVAAGVICIATTEPPFLRGSDASAMLVASPAWRDVATWLRSNTPPPSLAIDAEVHPEGADFHYPRDSYGVLTMWDFGNFLAAEARRPVVASERLSERVADVLVSGEEEGLGLLQRGAQPGERIRYVVIDAQTMTDNFMSVLRMARRPSGGFTEVSTDGLPRYSSRYDETLGARLFERGGSTLGRFRLIYDSPWAVYRFYRGYAPQEGVKSFELRSIHACSLRSPAPFAGALTAASLAPAGAVYDQRLLPELRVFEVVPGARVVGRAAPGARLHALITIDGEGIPRRTVGYSGKADASGAFSLHVAQPTGRAASATVRTDHAYTLYVQEDGKNRVWGHATVSEEAVNQGLEVPVLVP